MVLLVDQKTSRVRHTAVLSRPKGPCNHTFLAANEATGYRFLRLCSQLVGYQKLTQNTRYEKVALKFLAPKEGTVQYEIHAMCSAYLGADKKVLMKKTIAKKVREASPTLASGEHSSG